MNKTRIFLIVGLILASTIYMAPATVPRAHAANIGTVCIAPAGVSTCPQAPPLITQTAGKLLFDIVINSSASLNGFNIILHTNSSVLKPANVSPGNLLPSSELNILSLCIGGQGQGCDSSVDGPNTLHYSVTDSSRLVTAPVTGILFVANYTIAGISANSPITFQTGCSGTSVTGGVCVTIPNGSPVADTETVQGGKFSNQPYYDLQPVITTPPFTIERNSSNTMFLNLTSVNNFAITTPQTITLAGTVTPTGPTITITPTSVQLNSTVSQVFSTVNVTVPEIVPSGTYNLTFTATSGTLPPNTMSVSLDVPFQGFAVSANADLVNVNATYSGSVTAIITSIGNFAGNVNLTLSRPSQLNASFAKCLCNETRLVLHANSSNSTAISLNSTIAGKYVLTIVGTSGNLTNTFPIDVQILDFAMSLPSTIFTFAQNTTATNSISYSDNPGGVAHTMNVTIGSIYVAQQAGASILSPSSGISVTCSGNVPSNHAIVNVNASISAVAQCVIYGSQVGNYTVTVTSSTGVGTHRIVHAVAFPVQVLGPDFTVSSPSIVPVALGTSATTSITLARELGFNGNLTLALCFLPIVNSACSSPPTAIISPSPVCVKNGRTVNSCFTIDSNNPNATATILITASTQTPLGTYQLQVTAAGSVQHVITISILVVASASGHQVAVYSVTSLQSSATVGTSVSINVIVQNLGRFAENVTVVALVGDTSIAQQQINNLQPGTNTTVTLKWDTSGYSPGPYTIGAKVLGVNGQTNFSNNLARSSNTVTLNPASNSIISSSYFWPLVAAALIIIIAALGALFLRARKKTAAF